MGGQVLGGGVIVLVAVLLWLVYLLPSWHSRHQYNAAERNAVRLNQALRILAETSETPAEVRLELNARTALAQQKLARRAQAEREELSRRAQAEREQLAKQALAEREQSELERARLELAAERERARAALAVARAMPETRRARARRRARLLTTVVGLLALALAGWGVWLVMSAGSLLPLGAGIALAFVSGIMLTRMSRVRRRANVQTVAVVAERTTVASVQDLALGAQGRDWEPRRLPRPLTASAGSRAAAVLDAEEAQEALRQAAVEETMRRRAERQRPPSIDTARLARTGHVDDAEIEAHVRELLRSRAAG
jgi:ABC-type multidrug transport system fused ATPase/permease subunit